MNDHSFDSYSDVTNYLIRHEELAQISYMSHKDKMPAGMQTHDAYILHWATLVCLLASYLGKKDLFGFKLQH